MNQVQTIRSYRDDDEPRVLALMEASLGSGPAGARSSEFFRWKHLENPFGRSFMLVSELDDRIIGLRAFMRWRFVAGERTYEAVRAVDTATHPQHQGQGVFSALTRAALDSLRQATDLVFNTPNDKSLPGYLKMGWRTVGRVPISVRVHRPVRFARGWRSARTASEPTSPPPEVQAIAAEDLLAAEPGVSDLLAASEEPQDGLRTLRSVAFLRWRYAAASRLGYRAVQVEEGGRLQGLAIFRVRPRGRLWESTISDVIVGRGDRSVARRLFREVRRSADVDHLTCTFPTGSVEATVARQAGYVRSPMGMTLVVNALHEGIGPDPQRPDSWALRLGDLEVF
jgi:GNAT superfamily N-acetyltransferase